MNKFLYYFNVYAIVYHAGFIALTVSVFGEPLRMANVWGALFNAAGALLVLPELLKKK